ELRRRPSGYRESLSRMEQLIVEEKGVEDAVRTFGNGALAHESVPLALFAFLTWGPDFEPVVTNAARCGGDIDSICAMTGTLAGGWTGDVGLPNLWLDNLENGVKGRDEVARLASKLCALGRGY